MIDKTSSLLCRRERHYKVPSGHRKDARIYKLYLTTKMVKKYEDFNT